MKRNFLTYCITIGVFACFLWSVPTLAVEVIYPRDMPGANVYVTVPDGWLPVPNVQVSISVNGIPDTLSVSLTSETSIYPGVCTNYGDANDTSLDFELSYPGGNSFTLTPRDSGGRAVIQVNQYTFVLPRDDDNDGMADNWETLNCPNGHCAPNEDIDTGPDPESPYVGDGISNFDEYRGFRVSGAFVRGDPKVKDFFIHKEMDPQCLATQGASFAGQTLSTIFGSDISPLYANMMNNGVNVHVINEDEWVDNFVSYDKNQGVFLANIPDAAKMDRQISKNARWPLVNDGIVKGVRIVECLDLNDYSPLGLADKYPHDQFYAANGNAVLFVHRVLKSIQDKINAGQGRVIKYFTFINGSWVAQTPTYNPNDPTQTNAFLKIAFAWYAAHEALEHSFDVTDTAEGTNRVSYGYHHAELSGTNVDIKITQVIDKSTSGFNKFYIAKSHGVSDKREMRNLLLQ